MAKTPYWYQATEVEQRTGARRDGIAMLPKPLEQTRSLGGAKFDWGGAPHPVVENGRVVHCVITLSEPAMSHHP